MSRLDPILDKLEEEDPAAGIEAAKEFLENESPTDEERSQLAYGIAVGHFQLGGHEEASRWLKKTDDERRFLMLGFNLVELEKFSQAARAFEKAGETNAADKNECLLLQAQTLGLAQQFEEARKILDAQLKKELPAQLHSETLLARGTLALETEKPEQARVLFEKIVESTETDEFKSEATFHLVKIEQDAGKMDKAIEYANWLKDNGSQDFWRQAAQEELNKLQQDKRERQKKLRGYEY